jgi:soluble lytic murein transglycosylase
MMKYRGKMARILFYCSCLVVLVACADGYVDNPQTTLSPVQTQEPTPTLLPGLPTNTPQSDLTVSNPDKEFQATLPTPGPTATVPPPPTATPEPFQRLVLGYDHLNNEDFDSAIEQFEAGLQSTDLDSSQRQEALLGLAQAQLGLGENSSAASVLSEFLAEGAAAEESVEINKTAPESPDDDKADAYFFLGQSYVAEDDCQAAIGSFTSYLEANPDMAAYVQPKIAACQLMLGDRTAAVKAFEAAVEGGADRLTEVSLRFQLARLYEEEGEYLAAIEQYEQILGVARTENTRGQATYLAGVASLLTGDEEAAHARYLEAVQNYPQADESYLALQALVDAGIPVDDYQRGLVDYYAQAYEPAVAAFQRYLDANPDHREDAHLFLAWAFEGLGNVEEALAHIDAYIDAAAPALTTEEDDPQVTPAPETSLNQQEDEAEEARGWMEKAKLQSRVGLSAEAIQSYLTYLDLYPNDEDAPLAAWWAASLAESLGETEVAIDLYQNLAESYPFHQDAPEALYRAGSLHWLSGNDEDAILLWQQAADAYPDRRYGAASLLWLLKVLPEDEKEPFLDQAAATLFEDYFALRVRHIASDTLPFQPPGELNLGMGLSDQRAAEEWLRNLQNLDKDEDLSLISSDLANDDRLIRGQKLWRLGLREEAKGELESLRLEYSEDPVKSYQLALLFRDLGLYRSSILAATSVMRQVGVDVFGAPRFIGALAYPIYYADLVLQEADAYGIDPSLLFSLIRQESLFESFARSPAAAQGLSQVIPDTGAYIAQRLAWPDYVNEDLYKPYVGIAFGAYYLDQQLDAFDGDVAAALSAYNAGPGNAARWFGEVADDIDLYVETVDFSETKQYIERIYTGQAIYRYLYGE